MVSRVATAISESLRRPCLAARRSLCYTRFVLGVSHRGTVSAKLPGGLPGEVAGPKAPFPIERRG